MQRTGRGCHSRDWARYHTDLWQTDVAGETIGVVERALRGEGTSYAYLPPQRYVEGDPDLLDAVASELERAGIHALRGAVWTTDAPFREIRSAIAAAAAAGLQAIEMEQNGDDFEKEPDDGAEHALSLVIAAARGWRKRRLGETHQ